MKYNQYVKEKFLNDLLLIALGQIIALTAFCQDADSLKLKDYRPVSIYKTPQLKIEKAKYAVTDFHSHDYPKTNAELDKWVKTMDEAGIAKTMILTYSTGAGFDSAANKYARYKDRFEMWCGFDYTGLDQPGWAQRAVKELERCYKKGAKGIGELGDKGLGEFYSLPTPGFGVHIDDPRMKPLIKKCGELHMPISIHVAEDAWIVPEARLCKRRIDECIQMAGRYDQKRHS